MPSLMDALSGNRKQGEDFLTSYSKSKLIAKKKSNEFSNIGSGYGGTKTASDKSRDEAANILADND